MNLSFVLLYAKAVKSELRPVLQIKFQAKCTSIRQLLSSIKRSATAYAPSELTLFEFKNRLYRFLLPLSASQSSMTPLEPSWLQLRSSTLTVVLSISPCANAIALSTLRALPLRFKACSLLFGASRRIGILKRASS